MINILEKIKEGKALKLKGDYHNVKYFKYEEVNYKVVADNFVFVVSDEYELKMLKILN